tara:strand:- start:22 stop:423 length:402 start_codon:yes stop_codon:yes gene_type:complete
MKTYKEFNEAAALAIPAASKLAIPALGGILKGVKAITNRETGLSDSEKRRVGELMDMIKRKKQREKTQKTEKDILDYGREKEGIAERPKKQNAQAQVKEENKHRDAKLFYQYKRLQDPQKPVDPVRALKLKKA